MDTAVRHLWHPRHGDLVVVEESANLLRVEAAASGESFWLSRAELARFNRPVTPVHLLPTRQPVAADQPWQAYLRERGYINVHVWEGHVNRALDMVERASGYRYAPDSGGVIRIKRHEDAWAPSFRLIWTGVVPDGLPVKAHRRVKHDGWEIMSNHFVLDLLGLGFVFGSRVNEP